MPERKSTWSRLSVATLIASNLVPLYGVLMHGWDVFPIMVLFWLENVVIGVMNVVRMVVARPPASELGATKLFMIPFFCVHYGVFTLVHGIFVFMFFGGSDLGHSEIAGASELADGTRAVLDVGNLTLALVALVASHIVSFVVNFIGRGEYRKRSLGSLMATPYGRVVVLHLTILGGGALTMSLGSPAWALVVLVVIKIVVDLVAHLWEHRRRA